MPQSDKDVQTTENTIEAGPPRLHALPGEARLALEPESLRVRAPRSIRRQTTSPAVPAFGVLPGEFAIRTYLTNSYLTARDGGRHSIDAVISSATAFGPNEKFKLTTIQPDYTTLQTPSGYYVLPRQPSSSDGTDVCCR